MEKISELTALQKGVKVSNNAQMLEKYSWIDYRKD